MLVAVVVVKLWIASTGGRVESSSSSRSSPIDEEQLLVLLPSRPRELDGGVPIRTDLLLLLLTTRCGCQWRLVTAVAGPTCPPPRLLLLVVVVLGGAQPEDTTTTTAATTRKESQQQPEISFRASTTSGRAAGRGGGIFVGLAIGEGPHANEKKCAVIL